MKPRNAQSYELEPDSSHPTGHWHFLPSWRCLGRPGHLRQLCSMHSAPDWTASNPFTSSQQGRNNLHLPAPSLLRNENQLARPERKCQPKFSERLNWGTGSHCAQEPQANKKGPGFHLSAQRRIPYPYRCCVCAPLSSHTLRWIDATRDTCLHCRSTIGSAKESVR